MSKIIFDSGISLDGFLAGDNRGPGNPMGGVSGKLHQWMFKQKAFWEHIKMDGGEEYGADGKLIDDAMHVIVQEPGHFYSMMCLQEQVLTLWENECLKKGKSFGQKIYMKLMFMY